MTTKKYGFLVVTIRVNSEPGEESWESLEQTFNKAKDWLRFSTGIYFLFTSQTPRTWFERIQATRDMPSSYSVLIAPVDLSQRSGQNTNKVWDWIKKNSARQE